MMRSWTPVFNGSSAWRLSSAMNPRLATTKSTTSKIVCRALSALTFQPRDADGSEHQTGGAIRCRAGNMRVSSIPPAERRDRARSARAPQLLTAGERTLVEVQRLGDPTGAARHARQRIFRSANRHLQLVLKPPVDAVQERAATGKRDPLLHDVGDQLRRGLLDCRLDKLDDRVHRRRDGISQLDRADLHALRQPG